MERKCLGCHAPGGLAVPLAAYHDVRAWGRAIREEIVEQRMPPWSAAPGYGRFRDGLALTAREEATLLSWIDGGMPRGDPRDHPSLARGASSNARAAAPDRRIVAPPQSIAAGEELLVRRVTIPTGLVAERRVRRVVVRPGDRRVLRGALVFGPEEAGPTSPRSGQWLGGWLPWQGDVEPPAPHAFRLRGGSRLTLVLYYRGADQTVTDRPAVELSFAGEKAARAIDEVVVAVRPDGAGGRHHGEATLPQDSTVWALQPSSGDATASLELRARRPDGSLEVLLWVPRWRPEWPQALVLERPVMLPAGTVLSLITHDRTMAAAPAAASSPPRVILSLLR
jgi:hypothetical protein